MAKFMGVPERMIAALETAGIIADRHKTRRVTIDLYASDVATVTVEQLAEDNEIERIVKMLRVIEDDKIEADHG
jgi:hypothetical protein